MNPIRWPAWALALFGIVATVAGVLGVVGAPPAIGKATWAVVTVLGVVAAALAARRRVAATKR